MKDENKTNKREPKTVIAIASTGTRDSALYGSGSNSEINPLVTPSFMETKYDRAKKKNVWDLVNETIAAYDVNEVVSSAIKHIVAVLYRNMNIIGEDLNEEDMNFWESIKTLNFDLTRVPKRTTLVQIAQSIGINLIKSGNAFPYITKWGESWTGKYRFNLPIEIDILPVTSIDYSIVNGFPKFSIKRASLGNKDNPLYDGSLNQEDLDHVFIPKSDESVFAIPPFYSMITSASLKNEVDQSIWNVLCSFIAFVLHIIVDTSRSEKGSGLRTKRLTQKQLNAIVDLFKGSGKNRAVGTTNDVIAKFVTMDPTILNSAPIYDPISKRLDQAMGKQFFGNDILDSIALSGMVETFFQEPVEEYFNSLFLIIAKKNNMDMEKVPKVQFSPVAWNEENMIFDMDRAMRQEGGISLTDFVERRGLNFDDQMRKCEREMKKYPWLIELLSNRNENKDNPNSDSKDDDNEKGAKNNRKKQNKRG